MKISLMTAEDNLQGKEKQDKVPVASLSLKSRMTPILGFSTPARGERDISPCYGFDVILR